MPQQYEHEYEHKNGEIIKERYKIINSIGYGGFGETYLVEDIQLPGCYRVIKYLSYHSTNPKTWNTVIKMFRDEAAILRVLGNHPQIPQLYDDFEENQRLYLVQEYIQGRDFKYQTLTEMDVINVVYEVLKILNHIHHNNIKNVKHLDIKPTNLMKRDQDGMIFLIDFGAVKEVSTLTLEPDGITITTIPLVSPGYTPPEQFAGKPQFASDIYALGMTAIQLLTGVSPQDLEKDSDNEVIWENLISVNPNLARILTKMVRVSLQKRYSTANDVLVDLKPLTFLGQELIQRYKIISYLGGSGFSHTYLAEDTCSVTQNRRCLVKQFILTAQNLHIVQEVRSRLQPALESQKHFSRHKQVPDLLDNFIEETTLSLVYEFIDGENLSDKIKTGKHWNEAEITAFLTDVLELLSPIHQQGIIHGDIKPSNLIQRTEDKKFILIDFSKFKEIFTLEYSNGRIVKQLGGTPGYIPFQQKENQPEPSSDIYALGMTAIQLLTGVHPQDLERDSHDEVILPNGIQISSKLAKILTKMVRFHLGDRYQSTQEVLKDLIDLDRGLKPHNGIMQWLKKDKKLLFFFGVISIGFIVYKVIIYPNPPEQLLLMSCKQKLNEGKYVEAEINCQKSIDISPSRDAYFYKGNALDSQGKQDEAIINYKSAATIANDKAYILPNVSIGQIYNNKQDYQTGQKVCEDATKNNKDDFSGWSCLGIAQKGLQDYDNAEKSFEQAIQLSCNSENQGYQTEDDRERGCFYNLFNQGETLQLKEEKLSPKDRSKSILLLDEAIGKFADAIQKVKQYNNNHIGKIDIKNFEEYKQKAEKRRQELLPKK
ncbi:serine/threonine-protein kinase [Aphanizomenon flos-aquae]|jgi:serine/threonine protein kinase|uniref:non-specific serine/threonine protein kinase n=1 Tax=Aphanizomenon flos-aquae FACHB-1040 TaxID=2692887 RepID=A0ABR8C405_APHFL|nr:serine/threonine-protein kinase [Aphanizomenon flos-aquae]MBD2281185.1 protein kinase [Aphanizomenon flos-aquae FACHB-1040]